MHFTISGWKGNRFSLNLENKKLKLVTEKKNCESVEETDPPRNHISEDFAALNLNGTAIVIDRLNQGRN